MNDNQEWSRRITVKILNFSFFFSLKAEWMYSQSKGRHFSKGQHSDLLQYLVETCPLHPDKDWQEDKKLNLILSKVQEHQLSLRDPGKILAEVKIVIRDGFF